MRIVRTIRRARARSCAGLGRARADDGRLPRRATSRSSAPRGPRTSRSSPACSSTRRSSGRRGPRALPARRGARRAARRGGRRRPALRAGADEIYPPGFQTWVEVEELARILEGEHRPGHFRGVATVCLKLFNIVRPQRAYFGQKDAQQAAVIKRLVRDLDLELEIRVLPTVRDADGLALSSRNAYLSPEERERGARTAARAQGPRPVPARRPRRRLRRGRADFEPRVLAAAVRVGSTRLIDNVVLEGEPS